MNSTPDGFSALGLAPCVLKAIAALGYAHPTPIQQKAIPQLLAGRDVLAAAQTGTGKTAAFALPVITRMVETPKAREPKRVRALVLAPTRELAAQIDENIRAYVKGTTLTSTLVFGGVNIKPQTEALAAGTDFLVATPGRLLDHLGQHNVDISGVEFFVLDEADRMLDMGFIHDIRKIVRVLPSRRQTLMFSATFNDEIRELAESYLTDPVAVEVARNKENALIDQEVFLVPKKRKRELLRDLIAQNNWDQVLVFTRMKHAANRLAEQLNKDGIKAAAIHGNKSQSARTKALAGFKSHEITVLVATDIAARGLDIEGLPHVVNFELPNVPQDYVHRIGRTGRAGMRGHAVSLVSPDESDYLKDIERLLKKKLPARKAEGYEGEMPEALALEEAQADRARAEELLRMRQARKMSGARKAAQETAARAAREEERASGLSVNPEERFEKKIARSAPAARPAKPRRKPAAASVARALENPRNETPSQNAGARGNRRQKPAGGSGSAAALRTSQASKPAPGAKSLARKAEAAAKGRMNNNAIGKANAKAPGRAGRLVRETTREDWKEKRLLEERRRRAANIKSTVHREGRWIDEERSIKSRGYHVESVRSTLPPEMQRKLRGR